MTVALILNYLINGACLLAAYIMLRMLHGFFRYIVFSVESDCYEDRWRFLGIGYHIKEAKGEVFFKFGFIK